MEELYSIYATAYGGQEGTVRSPNLKLNYQTPVELTDQPTPSTGTNPEELLACAYSICFQHALRQAFQVENMEEKETEVTSHVSLSADKDDVGNQLSIIIDVKILGVIKEEAQVLIERAHNFCTFRKAFGDNIPVQVRRI
ncbi:hypothetical protein Q73_04375 [Bacillus coahuilensis m2-6]|uniref:Ohr family peroxiredoxin n=1 Tax=Bacillus coahuilensis TaxID=408580 RepID=UPI00018511D6|nr:Ohr family peroxiredoxin [Bacillus coahuilensis]KUP08893.1 hypothetical protein Q73_04375 [Bacillus coahuilensis m2-6]